MKYLIVIIIGACTLFVSGCTSTSASGTEEVTFRVQLENVSSGSDAQVLSEGFCVVETQESQVLDIDGQLAPAAFEPFAEYGDSKSAIDWIKNTAAIESLTKIKHEIKPGKKTKIIIKTADRQAYLTCAQMAKGSNDGLVITRRVRLFSNIGEALPSTSIARQWDIGMEENQVINSGYEAGQPTDGWFKDNKHNGQPTDPQQPVQEHPQLRTSLLKMTVTPQ